MLKTSKNVLEEIQVLGSLAQGKRGSDVRQSRHVGSQQSNFSHLLLIAELAAWRQHALQSKGCSFRAFDATGDMDAACVVAGSDCKTAGESMGLEV